MINTMMKLDPMAILVALVVHMTIGAIWYNPSVFGKSLDEQGRGTIKTDIRSLVPGILAHVVYTFVLAILIKAANATTVLDGFLIGMLVAVGFIGTVFINELIFEKLTVKFFLIKLGDEFVSLSAAGILLALWK